MRSSKIWERLLGRVRNSFKDLEKGEQKTSELIGQLVGFYSAFIVAERVVVSTEKLAPLPRKVLVGNQKVKGSLLLKR